MAVTTRVDDSALADLRAASGGSVLQSGDDGYDEARTVWNAMIDRRPAVIVRPTGAADVITAVNFAREHDLPVSVKGGGHNIAGRAVCDDGLVIDLSTMRSVRVDPEARTARVGPGATLADVDRETQAFGLVVPTGINSTTGIAGLTLGGGFGWVSRRWGLTVDNLRSVDIVTADGRLRHASETENEDLFWGVRGGGTFGVVTDFEFELHEYGPEVLSGLIIHPLSDARAVLEEYRSFAAAAPDEVTPWVVLRNAPPLPFIPEEWHGEMVLIFAVCYAGSVEAGEAALAPLRAIGDPIVDVVSPHQFTDWQQAFDPLLTPGARNYWKSHNFVELTDAMLEILLEFTERMPSPMTEVFVGQLGGAINRVPADATAYPHRDAEFVMNLHTRWEDPAQDEACKAWARELYDAMRPHATGGTYVNFIPEEAGEEQAAYGENYDRLVELKDRYDPENLFRLNTNVQPTA
ncbi:FAD-binding oxidoreductase [Haloglomus litoreum]|uniref:FAD-binding oxidoreductase n=1 Tax=Haloglomus litoreum TaxID=3034026 RepID=UPI0023E8987D|nr:FAD-binding oxidoreductase [Haloglomus sp. DT116]